MKRKEPPCSSADDDGDTCAVCFSEWEIEGDQMPLNLGSCDHALCKECVRRWEQPNGSVICPTCRVVSTAACITKSYGMIKLLKYQQKEEASTRINELEGRVGELRVGKASLQSLHKPLVCVPLGSSLTESEFKALRGLIGGQVKLKSLYRTSLHGSTYDNLLRCVGDKTGLVFVVRKGEYVFGAFISAGLELPDDPTGSNRYDCDVWHFSLAGHFPQPTKIDISRLAQYVAGREGSLYGASVRIGGGLRLGDDGSDWPAADIRSCFQSTDRNEVPEGYVGARKIAMAVLCWAGHSSSMRMS
ncbi:unnamed protein product [Vitrella brassicaformis CCMP3155]|uniref:RING-type domain-containing protein n=2 Tax=Vitrella brassicaformis TaxID=1169539 RepID=A0A0G4EF50_VITBC|nr:unnamed protein product [Vitrella brassicaformis CCMP3155]|eukprot:CEL94359.1 unnamed protein product [Vitrella brassicaformis CCMP3155]